MSEAKLEAAPAYSPFDTVIELETLDQRREEQRDRAGVISVGA